jgi:ABC-type dipeptide/oligopeptide/nickel transport system permease component
MSWLNLALALLGVALLLTLVAGRSARAWPRVRPVAVLALEVAATVVVTLALVTLVQLAVSPGQYPQDRGPVVETIRRASLNSLPLLALASALATFGGIGAAFWFTWARRSSDTFALAAAVFWAVPTFLLAIAAQELQAQIYSYTSLSIGGSFAQNGPREITWAAIILGARPAVYIFRQARVVLEDEQGQDYVRAARAKGLSWRRVASRYILRPALPAIASAWLISLRLMVGSLPLVEFFFAYPGLGNVFVRSFGLGDQAGIDPDLAIAAIAVLATTFFALEAAVNLLQQRLDPRIADVRLGEELAARGR